jgi:two-component system, response regulator
MNGATAVRNNPILLVEDNPDDETLALRALEKNHILNDVVVARDGAEALGYLFPEPGHQDTMPQVVLLDLKLPKVDGLEVLRRIRQDARTRHLPVVILTSSREERDLVSGYSAHANSYIRKPIDFAEFTEVVHQIGLYWLVLNETVPEGAS